MDDFYFDKLLNKAELTDFEGQISGQ